MNVFASEQSLWFSNHRIESQTFRLENTFEIRVQPTLQVLCKAVSPSATSTCFLYISRDVSFITSHGQPLQSLPTSPVKKSFVTPNWNLPCHSSSSFPCILSLRIETNTTSVFSNLLYCLATHPGTDSILFYRHDFQENRSFFLSVALRSFFFCRSVSGPAVLCLQQQ